MGGLSLIVPLLMPALAMRGGLLTHTWIYLALHEVAWLVYDVAYSIHPTLAPGQTVIRGFEEGIRVIAVLFALVATVAQRRVIPGSLPDRHGESRSPSRSSRVSFR